MMCANCENKPKYNKDMTDTEAYLYSQLLLRDAKIAELEKSCSTLEAENFRMRNENAWIQQHVKRLAQELDKSLEDLDKIEDLRNARWSTRPVSVLRIVRF